MVPIANATRAPGTGVGHGCEAKSMPSLVASGELGLRSVVSLTFVTVKPGGGVKLSVSPKW
jgi:hypothetical protein